MSDMRVKRPLLGTITMFFWFAQFIYIPFLTPYLLSISISAAVVGIIIGAYGFTQLILRIPLGILADIVKNQKIFISAGVFFAGISSVGMLIFPQPSLLIVANAISGIASATWVSFTILFSAYYDNSQSTKAIGTINVYKNTGTLLAFILGGFLYEQYGIHMLFIMSFLSGMAGLVLSFFIKTEPETRRTDVKIGTLVKVIRDKRLLFFSVLCVFTYVLMFGTVYSFTTSTAKLMGASGVHLSVLSILFSMASIIGAYFIGTKAAEKFGEENLILLAFILFAVYCAGIPLSPSIALLFPLQFMCGIGSGILTAGLMSNATKHIDRDKKSTAMGFYQSIYCLGITLGPIFMGVLVEYTSIATSFFLMAAIALLSALFVVLVYKYSNTFKQFHSEKT